MTIAFAGNPNSGKTTMYNALTGRHERVGNWAGVTVDRKTAPIRKSCCGSGEELAAVDLPGAYSMSPFTLEENITGVYIREKSPDVIVNIVDATNLSRSLFFTTQLLELGIPVVVALNKSDITEKKGIRIDTAALSAALNCPVVKTISTSGRNNGLHELIKTAVSRKGQRQKAPYRQGAVDLSSRKAVEAADRKRFAFVNTIVACVETRRTLTRDRNRQDRVDEVLTGPVAGLAIFAAVMFMVFHISQATAGPWIAKILADRIESFQSWAGRLLAGVNELLYALLVDGIIGGVGAVIGFLPLVMVLYFLLALLEDCGYLARATVVLDPLFKKVGLSGKSVIPFIIGTGCAVPGIMACRTIPNERERRAAAMLTPFMPCGAKLTVIALFSGVFFGDASWVGTLMYFVGIGLILLGALLVKKLTGHRAGKSFFIMELPAYKLPGLKRAFLSACSRGWAFIVRAGTVILLCNILVQIMQSFTWSFRLVGEGMESTSILASIASPLAVCLVPVVGVKAWQLAAAAVAGFFAKENVVGTLAVCYSVFNFMAGKEPALAGGSQETTAMFGLTKAAALAYLMFNLFTPPCFAAQSAMNAEMNSRKWMWGGIALQFAAGFTVSCLVYQVGTLLTTGSPGAGFLPGLLVVAAFAICLSWLIDRNNKSRSGSMPSAPADKRRESGFSGRK